MNKLFKNLILAALTATLFVSCNSRDKDNPSPTSPVPVGAASPSSLPTPVVSNQPSGGPNPPISQDIPNKTTLTVMADVSDESALVGPVEIKLTSSQPAMIRYTLDGSDPDDSSELYSKTLVLEDSGTLKFVASLADGSKSPIEARNYLIDHQRPFLILGI
jgi:hypothetical protein